MLHIKKIEDGIDLYKALGSDLRIQIIKLLLEKGEMNMNEIATLTRYNIPVIEVVINNHVLGMVRQWQTLFYGKRYSQTILNDKTDFVKVAEAMGAVGVRVTKKEEFAAALEKAISLNGPVLIDCQIDCDDKVFPMVAAGGANSEVFDETDLEEKNA